VSCSFQLEEEGFDHQIPPPDSVPPPEGLRSELDEARDFAHRIPEPFRAGLLCDRPIEIRQVDPINPFAPEVREPVKLIWLKAAGELPADPVMHRHLLAYASDFQLLGTSLNPHGTTFWDPRLQVASLDHAL
jgi:acyl-CoA thioesterase-2